MPESSLQTVQLHGWLARIRAGDLPARDDLLRAVCGRMEALARGMLRSFPNVRPDADTADVLQGALMRLMTRLQGLTSDPASAREFLALAAACVRRELLDLAKHKARSKRGAGKRPVPLPQAGESGAGDVPDRRDDPDELERWAAFHEAVEALPPDQREVVGLTFYHGWTQKQVAELLGVDESTVRRRRRAAFVKLAAALGGSLPDF